MSEFQEIIENAAHALEQGKLGEAIRLAQSVLSTVPGEPNACQIMALAHIRQGQPDEALIYLRKALETVPDHPQILNMMGSALRGTGDSAGARRAFRKSILAHNDYMEPRLNLANLNLAEGVRAAAREGFEAVVAAQPGNGLALAGLARLALQENEFAKAHDLSGQALAVHPHHIISLLTQCEALLRLKNDEEALVRARDLIARNDIEPTNKALALGFAAEACDRLKQYDQAFDYFTAANGIVAGLNKAVMEEPATPYHPAMVTRMRAYLDAHPNDSAPVQPDEAPSPVFLVGFPRSGTTLLEQILLAHSDVISIEEEQTFDGACRNLILAEDGPARLAALNENEAADYRDAYWRHVRSLGHEIPDGGVLVDKQPLDTILLPLIAKIFPRARILFAVRDPRDVVLSCFQQRFGINQAMFQFLDLESAAAYYDQVMALGTAARAIYPFHLREVRYDALVADLESEARGVIEFLGLTWNDDILNYREGARARAINTPSVAQVIEPIYTTATGKWRNYETHMIPVRKVLDPWASFFKYES